MKINGNTTSANSKTIPLVKMCFTSNQWRRTNNPIWSFNNFQIQAQVSNHLSLKNSKLWIPELMVMVIPEKLILNRNKINFNQIWIVKSLRAALRSMKTRKTISTPVAIDQHQISKETPAKTFTKIMCHNLRNLKKWTDKFKIKGKMPRTLY